MLTPTEGCFAAWTRVNHFFQIVNSKRNQAAAEVTTHQGQPETSQPRQGASFKARLRDARGVAEWTVRVLRHAEPLLFHDNGYWIVLNRLSFYRLRRRRVDHRGSISQGSVDWLTHWNSGV